MNCAFDLGHGFLVAGEVFPCPLVGRIPVFEMKCLLLGVGSVLADTFHKVPSCHRVEGLQLPVVELHPNG